MDGVSWTASGFTLHHSMGLGTVFLFFSFLRYEHLLLLVWRMDVHIFLYIVYIYLSCVALFG